MKKKLCVLVGIMITVSVSSFAQLNNNYIADYLKGDIIQKAAAVTNYAKGGDNSLSLQAIDYGLSIKPILGYDNDLNIFMISAVNSLNPVNDNAQKQEISTKLIEVFRSFPEDNIKICVLNKLSSFMTLESISLVNSYLADCLQKSKKVDEVIHSALLLLKEYANRSTFDILFLAHVTNAWPEYNDEIIEIYSGELINLYSRDVVTVSSVLPSDQKLNVLNVIENTPVFTDNLKGEVYENFLTEFINNANKNFDFTDNDIKLELNIFERLASLQWTRAASKATSFFDIAQKQYDEGIISSSEFCDVIKNLVIISNTTQTAVVLTSYLDSLNVLMAQNVYTSKEIVLTVINSLAQLGDKTAFDYLLAVGYFNYPQEVKDAAQEALTKLKW